MDQKLFVDTMVFLHFRPLGELDLPARVQSDTVTLVVPRITLRELICFTDSETFRPFVK